eukprot:1162143-Pelagomonas_calceolata.AAC.3
MAPPCQQTPTLVQSSAHENVSILKPGIPVLACFLHTYRTPALKVLCEGIRVLLPGSPCAVTAQFGLSLKAGVYVILDAIMPLPAPEAQGQP